MTLTLHVCGSKLCKDGKEHTFDKMKILPNGGTLVCSKCGLSAMDFDLLRGN